MKLCKNCRHWLPSEAVPQDPDFSRCGYERPISLVTGELKPILTLPYAEMERQAAGRCKPFGDHYEDITPPQYTLEETQELMAGDIRHE
jgi:hypothetical protein